MFWILHKYITTAAEIYHSAYRIHSLYVIMLFQWGSLKDPLHTKSQVSVCVRNNSSFLAGGKWFADINESVCGCLIYELWIATILFVHISYLNHIHLLFMLSVNVHNSKFCVKIIAIHHTQELWIYVVEFWMSTILWQQCELWISTIWIADLCTSVADMLLIWMSTLQFFSIFKH